MASGDALFRTLGRLHGAVARTWRWRGQLADGSAQDVPSYAPGAQLFAVCERDLLALAPLLALARFTVLVAPGRDGDRATAAAQGLGARAVRGSSLHDPAVALGRLLEEVEATPGPFAIVVDGPLGPSGHVKPGILACSARSRRAVVAVGVAARRKLVFRSTWSQIYLPLPFARVAVALAPDLAPAAGRLRAELPALTRELEASLARAQERAEALRAGRTGRAS